MPDPTLKRSSVTIGYTASDGYRRSVNYSSRGRMGIPLPPQAPMLEGLEELARLCALFGHADEARAKFDAALSRVAEWRSTRLAGAQADGRQG